MAKGYDRIVHWRGRVVASPSDGERQPNWEGVVDAFIDAHRLGYPGSYDDVDGRSH